MEGLGDPSEELPAGSSDVEQPPLLDSPGKGAGAGRGDAGPGVEPEPVPTTPPQEGEETVPPAQDGGDPDAPDPLPDPQDGDEDAQEDEEAPAQEEPSDLADCADQDAEEEQANEAEPDAENQPAPDAEEADEPAIQLAWGETEEWLLTPGRRARIALPLAIQWQGKAFFTHLSAADGEPLAYTPEALPEAYDQALTAYIAEAQVTLAEELPANWRMLNLSGGIVQEGENHGYVVMQLSLPKDARPGIYRLPLRLLYTPVGEEEVLEAELTLALEVQPLQLAAAPEPEPEEEMLPMASVPWGQDAIIVTTHEELRAAVTGGQYATIYLGYTEENQGEIAYQNATGIPITRSLVIDGTDPRDGTRMRLVDYPSSGNHDGLYASADDLTVTIQNMDITGHNYYGVMYGTGRTYISLNFINVDYQGRQIAHNQGSHSTVSFTDCRIVIQYMHPTGEAHEVLEATSAVFYGENDVSRPAVSVYSMFYIYGTGDKSLTVAPGAVVRLFTNSYMMYTDSNTASKLHVYGDLSLVSTSAHGSATYDTQNIGEVTVFSGGSLTIDHQHTIKPTLRVRNLTVQQGARLELRRAGSTLPLIGVANGGSAVFDDPALVVLENPSGPLIRSVDGSPPMTLRTRVINRYQNGSLTQLWNNADLSAFSTGWTLATGGGSLTSVSGLGDGGRGAAIGASVLSSATAPALMADGMLRFGQTVLSIDEVEAGARIVTGKAKSGAAIQVREYPYDPQSGLGSLLQSSSTTASGGGYTLAEAPLESPIAPSGTRIYALSYDGVLQAHTYRDPVVTQPVFLSVPEQLPFLTTPLSVRDQLIPRAQSDWKLVVYDPRQSGEGFHLTAKMTAPLSTAQGDTLTDGLVLVQGQTVTPLGEAALPIARGDTSDGISTYEIGWEADQGLIARLAAFEGVPDAAYSARVDFTLSLGP